MNRTKLASLPALALLIALTMIPASAQDWVASVAQRSEPAVVTVVSYDGDNNKIGFGSGFIVRDDGLIATNYHVIKTATKVEVLNPAIGSCWVRGVVAIDRKLDFAVLKIGEQNLPTLSLGNSGQVRLGEGVVAIGNPKGLSGTVSAGLISQFRKENSVRLLQISAPIYPGNSGGPLINRQGEVIGIITARIGDGPTLGLALPINYLRRSLEGAGATKYSLRDLAQLETQAAESDQKEKLEALIRENFRAYEDPRRLFSLLIPQDWRVQHDQSWSKDGLNLTSTTVIAPRDATLSELHGYVSEGLRIVAHLPRPGNVWTSTTRTNWEQRIVNDLLAANPGFAHTKTERIPLLGAGRLNRNVAAVHHFIGEDRRLPEPEKTVKFIFAHPEVMLSIEVIAPISKLKMIEVLEMITALSFSWNGQ